MNPNFTASLRTPYYVPNTYPFGPDVIDAEPEVRYFLRHLEALGAIPLFSCGGHDPRMTTEERDGCAGHGAWYCYVALPRDIAQMVADVWPFVAEIETIRKRQRSSWPLDITEPGDVKLRLSLCSVEDVGYDFPMMAKIARLHIAADALDAAFGVPEQMEEAA